VCEIIRSVLTAPRDATKLRAEVLEMRATMAQHKPGNGPLDVKLSRGGLVDVEFIVHYLQLREGKGLHPRLGEAIPALVAEGLLPEAMIGAHAALSRLLVAARLLAPDAQVPPPAAQGVLAKACGCGDWDDVMANLAEARGQVAAVWRALFDEELEIT
jgi:[glutamine synthetase] adenylyltransferase / [glutamine synthetase]-adenylyl-L-tyrosine phosphorylase